MARKFYEVTISNEEFVENYAVSSSSSPTRPTAIGKAIRRFFTSHSTKRKSMNISLIIKGMTEYEYRSFYSKRRVNNGIRVRKRR